MIPLGIQLDHEYYIVELYNVEPPSEMFTWLKEQFGNGRDGRWLYKHPKVYFANSKDHLMFTLRFS